MTPELIKILQDVKDYCEDQAIYDKLSSYGDFYYRIVKLLDADRTAKALNGTKIGTPKDST